MRFERASRDFGEGGEEEIERCGARRLRFARKHRGLGLEGEASNGWASVRKRESWMLKVSCSRNIVTSGWFRALLRDKNRISESFEIWKREDFYKMRLAPQKKVWTLIRVSQIQFKTFLKWHVSDFKYYKNQTFKFDLIKYASWMIIINIKLLIAFAVWLV